MKNIKRTHDLTGQKFGKLTVIGIDDRGEHRTYWYCQCDCGNITSARYKREHFDGLESLFADVGQYRGNQQTADTVERSE